MNQEVGLLVLSSNILIQSKEVDSGGSGKKVRRGEEREKRRRGKRIYALRLSTPTCSHTIVLLAHPPVFTLVKVIIRVHLNRNEERSVNMKSR